MYRSSETKANASGLSALQIRWMCSARTAPFRRVGRGATRIAHRYLVPDFIDCQEAIVMEAESR